MAEGCINAARIARERGKTDLASRLERLGSLWESVFDEDGYITKDSEYYEGSRYNYSFRPCDDMERRIALAGGRERFIEMLDRFFGYGADSVVQPTDPRTIIRNFKRLFVTIVPLHTRCKQQRQYQGDM